MSSPAPLGKRAAEVPVRTDGFSIFYRPRHCAGDTCLHNHKRDRRPGIPLVRSNEQYAEERELKAAEAAERKPWSRVGAS